MTAYQHKEEEDRGRREQDERDKEERRKGKRKGDMQRGIERIEDKREWRGRE